MISLNECEFHRVVEFVKLHYGINLEKKYALVQARLALEIEREGYTSFRTYFDEVFAAPNGAAAQAMIDKLSTNHTFFFREPASFDHLVQSAFPEFVRRGLRHVLIWSAAASTGQECYTIAMLLDEYCRTSGADISFSVVGSDINSQVLKTAAAGVYSAAELARIPSRLHSRCCLLRDNGSFAVAPEIKARVSWRRNNLVGPLSLVYRYHVIFCRNVMIYFDAATKQKLTQSLHRAMYEKGLLYIGNTETIDSTRRFFSSISPSVFLRKSVMTYD